MLAEIVRLDRAHHRPVAGDSPEADAVKIVARAHSEPDLGPVRQVLPLHAALREFFPAGLQAFADLDAHDTLSCSAPHPIPIRPAPCHRRGSAPRWAGPTAAARPSGPRRSRRSCGRRSCASRLRSRPPTPPSCPGRLP